MTEYAVGERVGGDKGDLTPVAWEMKRIQDEEGEMVRCKCSSPACMPTGTLGTGWSLEVRVQFAESAGPSLETLDL